MLALLFLPSRHAQIEVVSDLLPLSFTWTEHDWGTPPSIRVYEGFAVSPEGQPIKAWYIDVDYADTSLVARPYLSTTPIGKEPSSALATKVNAYVAINGGYFDMTSRPAATFGLVKSDGRIVKKNISKVTRPNGTYHVTRSAFGIRPNRTFDISWIHHFGDTIYSYPEPTPNTTTIIAPPPTELYPAGGAMWNDITDAIGGGPVLIRDGQVRITYAEEVFFRSGFESLRPYPRSAVGYTANNHLILFVVDGKRPEYSRGLTLPELVQEMLNLGCSAAMNLDGGGSSTLVASGTVLNQPADGTERSVTSILAVVPATAGVTQ